MKLSAFTIAHNASKLYYPIQESISSVLPLVDEVVVVLGKGDADDKTVEQIKALHNEKIKLIHTEWDLEAFPNGMVNAQQTDLAKSHCTGDWLIYLQADEVLHENDYSAIIEACESAMDDDRVEALVFNYLHFWGDYNHIIKGHTWYDKEIRVIRNQPQIHSWQSAQSFRWMPSFDGKSYRQKVGTRKLNVKLVDATVYHYGWVRPPEIMTKKMNALDRIHSHESARFLDAFDYGNLSAKRTFEGDHPRVMHDRIRRLYWQNALDDAKSGKKIATRMKHNRLRYKWLTFIEQKLLGGKKIGAYRNFRILD